MNTDRLSVEYPMSETAEKRERRYAESSARYKKCQDEATKFFREEMDRQNGGWPLLLAVDLGTVLFGWLIVWMIVSVVRWINRGFASA